MSLFATDTPDRVRLRLGGRARVKGKFSAPRDSNGEEIDDATGMAMFGEMLMMMGTCGLEM